MNVLWLCFTVTVTLFSVDAQLNSNCNSNDSMVLKRFMDGMESAIDGWTSNSSNCCDWDGITCDSTGKDNVLIGHLHNSNPSNLVYLDVSLNYLSGNLPDFFHNFPNLTYFAAHSNNLNGGIPLSLLNSRSISSLILRNNSFSGSIELNCSAMVNLVLLDLVDNKFTGSIPNNLPSCPSLKTIDLGGNNLTGQIPESFKGFNSLCYLLLSMCNLNNLSGSLQILQNCPNLTTLVLSQSFDSEEMPSDANLQFKRLKTLMIPNCKLTGMIPVWLNGLTKLQILDLSWNELTGRIPHFLGHLQSLVYLDLSNNYLNGEIPKSLTQLPDLQFHDNPLELSLEFPVFMRRGMNGNVLRYSYGTRFPPTLDLSNNFLTGPIWPEFGNLTNLHVLNLKYNELSGTIPSNLANLTSIETLDLSHNDLTGEIPLSLVRLGMLSKFSVAYNNLTGIIPSGGQFSTFSVSSFEGNPGLCGEFVLSCVKNQESLHARVFEDIEESIISLPVWTGFGIGFLFAVILLLVLPRIRDTQNMDKFE
ncbi:hypothetical protein L1987_41585 [Smallanthus sonchifolius]|uniref:Uncharacterized protein n=1 Tax=Smallanthus sonchifolius TaxID=185202 RepID=A0ACB9GVP8_9ASTR|nr:hypothetical protein L1987_41585 [Smallanthus sonchifolius]